MINRNKNKLQPKTGSSEMPSENISKGSARERTQVNSMKQKAVRQLLEQTLF